MAFGIGGGFFRARKQDKHLGLLSVLLGVGQGGCFLGDYILGG